MHNREPYSMGWERTHGYAANEHRLGKYGADAGHRDYIWLKRMAEDNGWNAYIEDRPDNMACLGVWGPNARKTIQALADDPEYKLPRS